MEACQYILFVVLQVVAGWKHASIVCFVAGGGSLPEFLCCLSSSAGGTADIDFGNVVTLCLHHIEPQCIAVKIDRN